MGLSEFKITGTPEMLRELDYVYTYHLRKHDHLMRVCRGDVFGNVAPKEYAHEDALIEVFSDASREAILDVLYEIDALDVEYVEHLEKDDCAAAIDTARKMAAESEKGLELIRQAIQRN